MAIEGTTVFAALQENLQRAGAMVDDCDQQSAALEGQIRELVSRRGEALLALARHFLPEISRPTVEKSFEGIRGELLGILARKEQAQRKGRDRIAQAGTETRELDAAIDDVTHRLNEKVALRERLETEVTALLKGNEEFQRLSKLALQAEERLHRNEQRVEEMEREAAEKLPAYQKSRLFQYLYQRKYATPEYQTTGIIRELDAWVARLVKYVDARVGYEFLMRTPELVAAEVARRRDDFTGLMQQVEEIQKAEADRVGLTDILQQGEQLGAERDRLVLAQEEVRRVVQSAQKELSDLDQTQNAFYLEAVDRYGQFLGETRLGVLQQRARQTPEPADDAIVAELGQLDEAIEGIKPRLNELDDHRRAADRIRDGLDVVVRRFRQSNFDSIRSYFEGIDPYQEVNAFTTGMVDVESLWNRMQSAHQFRPHWVENTASGAAEVLSSPTGRVLIGAMIDVATQAMEAAAHRGMQRRAGSYGPTGQSQQFPMPMPMPMPEVSPPTYSPPEPAPGSFTTGEGF